MMKNYYPLKINSYRMLQNFSTVYYLTCVSEHFFLNTIIRSTLKLKKLFYMSVEGLEFPTVGSMKYFKICEGYELKLNDYQQTHIITLVQNLQFLAHLCPKYHIKPIGSDQNFVYIVCKNFNSSTTGRHAKLCKRKFD